MSGVRFCLAVPAQTDPDLTAYRRADGFFVLSLRSEEAESFPSYEAAVAKLAEVTRDLSVADHVRKHIVVQGFGWQPAPGYKVSDYARSVG